ncbi:uncharacterized protein SEPMUDRAFT_108912 [Sphaerulina musiva SO2202]|uniref:Uncharacterized protein n=1 Tax=Sphaerulina musiva (strain SO2202) TaxID=692275 RepID=N1QFN5_SPHMS|nr:uncharacterized protein SEPMUDRAFT_108912 [Sphaerulina musiva SO2202]EMF12118.1 hypothetical protein SEPMUDRAFT_108912 [Sphaerulina musiva SO2202]
MSLTRFTRLSTRISSRQFSVYTTKLADKSKLDAKNPNSIGREFESDGKIGGKAQAVGGAFAADGKVGKEFTKDGAIGGKAQEMAESKSVFDKDGAIGKEFQADGKIGGAAESVGGVFSKDGAVGKQVSEKAKNTASAVGTVITG